jgi:nitrilase
MDKLAVIQKAPVVLDRERTVGMAVELVGEAAGAGAAVVVFTEAFVPGYPAWMWRLRPGGDWGTTEAIHQRLLDNAVDLGRDHLAPLVEAARQHQVTVLCGIHERDGSLGGATLYNSVVVIGPDGSLLNRHRKLMPTNPERMVWGTGDASGLKVVGTPCGLMGALICWESYMPLSRFALYAQGLELYVAPTYDSGDDWIGTLRYIAREGGCWVVGSGTLLRGGDMPADLPDRDRLYPDDEEWVNPGDSLVIAPGGEVVAGPLHCEEGILYANIDPARAAMARRTLDVVGHYARPDIFTLQVDTCPQRPVVFGTSEEGEV